MGEYRISRRGLVQVISSVQEERRQLGAGASGDSLQSDLPAGPLAGLHRLRGLILEMAGPPAKSMVIASLFDRLTDQEPSNSREILPPEADQRAAHKASVARDLTHLLNACRSEADIPEEFEDVRESLAAYGVQDFTTAPMDREAIRRSVER